MPAAPRNVHRSSAPIRKWKVLRAVTHAEPPVDDSLVRRKISELEDLIVGTEERACRRRALGILPDDSLAPPHRPADTPLRHVERMAARNQRLKGFCTIGMLGLVLIAALFWLAQRLLATL